MELEALKRKSKYKSTDKWLDAVYRNNKELIDKRLSKVPDKKFSNRKIFKDLVHEHMEKGLSPTKALHKVANSEKILPRRNRLAENAIRALKNAQKADPTNDLYTQFRELTKEKDKKGRLVYTKIDLDKFTYEDGTYIYDGKVKISFTNSPLEIFVGRI